MRSRVGAGSAKGRRPLSQSMGGGRCRPASPTPRQNPKRPTYGRPRRAIGGNERHADEECGSCESSRENERRRVPRGQRSPTRDMMSADARGNVHQRGDTESRADLAGRIDQPTRKSLLKIGDAAAAQRVQSQAGLRAPLQQRRRIGPRQGSRAQQECPRSGARS